MTTPRAPQPAVKRSGPLLRSGAYFVLYAALTGVPVLMWHAVGNPVAATVPYVSLDQAELLWNTLRLDPAAAEPEFRLAFIDAGWILWTPFALAAVLQLLITVLCLPRTVVPRVLVRLTPSAVVSLVVTGTATVAQAHTAAIQTTTLHDHDHGRAGEHTHHHGHGRRRSTLETQILEAIEHADHARPDQQSPQTRTVRPGESLWSIAQDVYGRGQDWREIYDANRGHSEPDGESLTDPDLIKRGWTLDLPDEGRATAVTPAPRRPRAANGPATATTGRAAPEPAAPAATDPTAPNTDASGAHHTVPPTTATAHDRSPRTPRQPAATRAKTPWTTGVDVPDGGYIGISLLMAVAGATLTLRRRARRTRRTGQDPDVPESVKQLTVIAGRAQMAAAREWDPELETDPTPPPLLRPRPEHLIFGTAAGTDEAILDPQRHPLTVYAGPGAHDAAAALALSALASWPPHRLVTTETLARQLLGADTEPGDPTWLALTPDTPTALSTAATARGAGDDDVHTLVIADAHDAGIFQISAALAADKQHNRLAILLIGDPGHLAAHPLTHITLDAQGRPTKVTGPRAAAFASARFHTLPRPTAADLYTTLRHDHTARSAHRIPAQARGAHHIQSADQHPESDPADDEHHLDTTATPAPPEEAEPDPCATALTDPLASATAVHRTSPTGSPARSAPRHAPILLRLLGPLVFENTAGQTRPGPGGRNAQLLTYLALHPRGRTLQQITTAIWNTDKPGGPNRTLVRLRQELHTVITELAHDHIPEDGEDVQSVIREPHGTYHLNHRLIQTDHAAFTRLETQARTEHNRARRTELAAQALAHVRGDLAEGVSDLDQTWLVDERADLENQTTSLAAMSQPADPAVEATPQTTRVTSTAVTTASR